MFKGKVDSDEDLDDDDDCLNESVKSRTMRKHFMDTFYNNVKIRYFEDNDEYIFNNSIKTIENNKDKISSMWCNFEVLNDNINEYENYKNMNEELFRIQICPKIRTVPRHGLYFDILSMIPLNQ